MEKTYVYNVHPVRNQSKLKIKSLGYVSLNTETKLKDVMIKRSMIADNVFCFFFKPTITHKYLCVNNKIPVLYGRVDYMKKMIRRPLMSVWLFFNADEEKYRNRKSLIGKALDGKFTIDMEIDGVKEIIDDQVDVFPGREDIIKHIEDVLRSEDSLGIYSDLIDEIETRRSEEAKKLNFPSEPPQVTITSDDIKKLRSGQIDLQELEHEHRD